MKSIIIIAFRMFLLIGCKKEEEVNFQPKNGDVSFTIDGQRYSSPLNWSIEVPNTYDDDYFRDTIFQLIIKDTLGFDFSQIMMINNSGICGVVIPVEYKDPKFNSIYARVVNDSCFVLNSYWKDEKNTEIDTLAVFEIINGSFEQKMTKNWCF